VRGREEHEHDRELVFLEQNEFPFRCVTCADVGLDCREIDDTETATTD
jgi:hypothetical protein